MRLNPTVYCLAQKIYLEAHGEPMVGKVALGHVVLNRAADRLTKFVFIFGWHLMTFVVRRGACSLGYYWCVIKSRFGKMKGANFAGLKG